MTPVRSGWQSNAGTLSITDSIAFADASHGWLVYSDPYPLFPNPPSASGVSVSAICDGLNAPPPQHLEATDDGGATWREVLH